MHNLGWTIREHKTGTRALWPACVLALLLHGALLFAMYPEPMRDSSAKKSPQAIQLQIATAPELIEPEPVREQAHIPPTTTPSPVKAATKPAKPAPEPQAVRQKVEEERQQPQQVSSNLDARQQLLSQYLSQVKQRIQKEQRYPRAARRRRLQGSVEVSFQWSATGALLSQSIKSSSGQKVLDVAAMQMLKNASPLPPAPAGLHQQDFIASLPVNFLLN